MDQRKFHLINWLRVFTWVYFTLVFAWALAHFLLGDHPWWMFPANALSLAFFFPLPFVFLAAFWMRHRGIWIATLLVFLLAVLLYGKYYLPPALRTAQGVRTASAPQGQAITVMTYNTMGYNKHPESVVDAILASGVDVVALQELNPGVAQAIQQRLASKYPYQQLDPQEDVNGSGVISRYPLRLSDERLPGAWVGTPQIVFVTLAGKSSITILNAHAFATHPGAPEYIQGSISDREQQARAIKDFVETHPEPVIAAVDFNSTSQNATYPIVTSVLSDAWAEAGWGMGHTFPGVLSSSGARLTVAGMNVPTWLLRIDYIFYSQHFRAVDAQIGPWDGYSDHRPVIARLVLTDQ